MTSGVEETMKKDDDSRAAEEGNKSLPQENTTLDDQEGLLKDGNPEFERADYVCSICNKSFASGKALGGHKRIHFQAGNKSEGAVGDGVNRGNEGEESVVSCYLCRKRFRSKKALFGHMRLHPDRGWTGVVPPDIKENKLDQSTNSTLSNESQASAGACVTSNCASPHPPIKGWAITAKRGSNHKFSVAGVESSPKVNEQFSSEYLEMEMQEAAEALVQLSKMSPSKFASKQGVIQEESNSKEGRDEKRKEKKVSYLNHIDEKAEIMDRGHRCSCCNRLFPTHQALGGHMGSHYKAKNDTDSRLEAGRKDCSNHASKWPGTLPSTQHQNQGWNLAREWLNGKENSMGNHKCEICSRTFSTGQALGGHKRLHRKGESASCSRQTISGDTNQKTTRGRPFLFDLNEPAPEFASDDDGERRVVEDYSEVRNDARKI